MTPELQKQCVNTIRFLSADGVQKAKSGHPGAPMGLADVAFVIWNKFLRYNAKDPQWANRDRFVLSGGHGSMLLYSMLHLSEYDLPLEQLKQFRQWGSQTAGHPEYGMVPGIECTTGPLGAGISNATGIALGLKMSQSRFNKETPLIDAHVYTLCGDGDIQEGITAEAVSFAGHLGLGNLTVVYDQNEITIGGNINLSMSEDVGKRFEAYGWHVQACDGHDHAALEECLNNANAETSKPSLIVARTIIGKGAPNKQGTASSHGAPLGDDEIKLAKEQAGWPLEPTFHVPDEVRTVFQERGAENQKAYDAWQAQLTQWKNENPESAALWQAHQERETPADLLEQLVRAVDGKEGATRQLSQAVIQEAARLVPAMAGGSADLEPSNLTLIKEETSITPTSFSGRNIHFGIREHAMGGIANGLFLSGGWSPYCATFAVFSDYMRASIRLAALSHIPTTFVFTHDSFWVGEDGPTHQPVEHNWALRLIPNLNVWRPADALETAAAWAHALECPHGQAPSALMLTRQGVSTLERAADFDPKVVWNGGYVVQEASKDAELILVSTGSEGGIVQDARKALEAQGVATRHVSLPCLERFEAQDAAYRDSVLIPGVKTIVVEAGVTGPWYRYADFVIGRDTFGDSAPGKRLSEEYGLTSDTLTQTISDWLGR